mmetsp:Transcript_27287/g.39517  ORF Transcript_27287/g.39517 Transcript_27287/m.39517 type:complete len:346 (-) Transcript_27287:349-1386(-)
MKADEAISWHDFITDCPTWVTMMMTDQDCDTDNTTTTKNDDKDTVLLDVCTKWRESELSLFPHDHSCIDTSLTISDLSPQLRARFWRYLRDSFGMHYPELPKIIHYISLRDSQYLRVKELFETCEAFQIIGNIIASTTSDDVDDNVEVDCIYDLACGHGLLGILLAYRFPTKKVVCVDLEERKSYHVFKSAFVTLGESYQNRTPLSNLEYRVDDLRNIQEEVVESSFLVSIHACNEANKYVADMSRKANAGWAVMPCCIRSGLYLRGASILDLSSEDRYKVLCGVFAEANDARLVRKISRDITARPIIIARWGMLSDRSSCAGEEGGGSRDSLEFVVKRGAMPPL